MKWLSATGFTFSSITKAPNICAARPLIFAAALPGPASKSRTRTQVAPADAGHHSKRRRKRRSSPDIERASTNLVARLDGLRSLSLRRTLFAAGQAPDQLLRVDGRDFIADRVRVRGV